MFRQPGFGFSETDCWVGFSISNSTQSGVASGSWSNIVSRESDVLDVTGS